MESAERVVENASAKVEECLGRNLNLSENSCPAYYDGLLCWDPTPWNTLAVQPCFKEFHGVQYDDTRKYSFNMDNTLNYNFDYLSIKNLGRRPSGGLKNSNNNVGQSAYTNLVFIVAFLC